MTLANPSSTTSDASNSAGDSRGFGVHWSLQQALTFVEACYDRDALLETLLGFSQRCLSNRMVLLLGNKQAKPYRLQGWPQLDLRFREPDALLDIKIPLSEDAPFFEERPDEAIRLSYTHARRPEELGIGQLFVELTLFPPERVVFQTVRIGTYPAIALFGEPLQDASNQARGDLQTCARAIGEQLAKILRLTRSDALPPAEDRVPTPPTPQPPAPAQQQDDDLYEEQGNRSMIPGLAVESSVSQEIMDPSSPPGATAFGLPFADKKDLAEPSASATAFGLPFVDATSDATAGQTPEPRVERHDSDFDSLEAELDSDLDSFKLDSELDPDLDADGAAEASTPSLDEDAHEPERPIRHAPSTASQEPKTSTLEGGFTVTEFAPGLDSDASDEHGPKPAPKAQILRHISLKEGRRSGRHKAISDPSAGAGEQDAHPPLERLFERDLQTRQNAKKEVLEYHRQTRARDEDWFDTHLRPFLHAILARDEEDIRTEVAADLLGSIRDAQSVDILLESLDRFHGRIQDSVFNALRAITYLDFEPSTAEWRRWRAAHPRGSQTDAEERGAWIVDALNSPSVEIREMVYQEIESFARLDLNYHPNQPEKLRMRAQQDMRHWLTLYSPE